MTAAAREDVEGRQIAARVVQRPADQWLTELYIVYALYTVRDRALLAGDGLKPVNRNILWSMFEHGVVPGAPFLKAARVAADTMAYHPHGNTAIEDALARMAQPFALRVPLVEPYGSVGAVTGDTAASARYWEARLTPAAMELLAETREGAVEMGTNYDGKLPKPSLLPVRWPNDIVNGTQGIAVGYAAKMPSHNPGEVMDAAIATLWKPDISVDELLSIMPGPDLPTGGTILAVDGVRDYYATGQGRFLVRGHYVIEPLPRNRSRIVFDQLPFGVSAEDVISEVRSLRSPQERKVGARVVTVPANKMLVSGMSSINDFTDMDHGMRLVVETTQGTNPVHVVNELFATTKLQDWFSANCTVLDGVTPKQTPMADLLRNFVEFRKQCTIRRTKVLQRALADRIHRLDGLEAILGDVDRAVAIIRGSDSVVEARSGLMSAFSVDAVQADVVLSMQLRRLTKSDVVDIRHQRDVLQKKARQAAAILKSPTTLNRAVEADLRVTKAIIDSPRRSVMSGLAAAQVKDLVADAAHQAASDTGDAQCVLTRFADGTLLRNVEPFGYSRRVSTLRHSPVVEQVTVSGRDTVVLVDVSGQGHQVSVSAMAEGRSMRFPDVGVEDAATPDVVGMCPADGQGVLLLATSSGGVKVCKASFPGSGRVCVAALSDEEKLVGCRWMPGDPGGPVNALVVLYASDGHVLVFDGSTVNATGNRAGTVRGMRLSDGMRCVGMSAVPVEEKEPTMALTAGVRTLKTTLLSDIPVKGRGGMGVAVHGGGDTVLSGWAGEEPGVCLAGKPHTRMPAPPVTRRGTHGVELGVPVFLGGVR